MALCSLRMLAWLPLRFDDRKRAHEAVIFPEKSCREWSVRVSRWSGAMGCLRAPDLGQLHHVDLTRHPHHQNLRVIGEGCAVLNTTRRGRSTDQISAHK